MTNKENGLRVVELMRPKVRDLIHHYEAGDKYYIHFRCDDEDTLRFLVGVAEASNNPMMIQLDNAFYYTLIIHHNYDILEHYLTGKGTDLES